MQTAAYARYEYVDATAFTTAAQLVSGDFQSALLAAAMPGLVRPDVMTVSGSGLTISVGLPPPFAALYGNGVLANAHGTATGADTQTYSVPFSGVVPGAGSQTVYLLASLTQIQQNPYQVVGPPPGHPDYNPNFIPYTAYASTVDSLNLFASSGVADNVTTFELARTTLSAGATGVGTLDFSHQWLATSLPTLNAVSVTANKMLGITDAGIIQRIDTAGVFVTLPSAAAAVGREYPVVCRQGGTVQTVGSDLIYGLWGSPTAGAASITMQGGQSLVLVSDGKSWQAIALSGDIGSATGMIVWFATSSAPLGWYECNGAAKSRTTDALLFNIIGVTFGPGDGHTTFNLPDMRGQFIRGWDDSAGIDPGRAFGSNQSSGFGSHSHTITVSGTVSGNANGTFTGTASGPISVNGTAVGSLPVTGFAVSPEKNGVAQPLIGSGVGSGLVTLTGTGTGTLTLPVSPNIQVGSGGDVRSAPEADSTTYNINVNCTVQGNVALPVSVATYVQDPINFPFNNNLSLNGTAGPGSLAVTANGNASLPANGSVISSFNNVPLNATGIAGNTGISETRPVNVALLPCICRGLSSPLAGATAGPGITITAGQISLTPIPNNTLMGNITGASAAATGISIGQYLDSLYGSGVGQLLYRGGSGWTTLAIGASGQALEVASGVPEWVSPPWDVANYVAGTYSTGQRLARFPMTRAISFSAGFSGAYAINEIPAAGTTIFSIQKNGTQVGTMTFAAGASGATFSGGPVTYNPGDVFAIVAPVSPDTNLAGVGWALPGTR